MVMLVNVDLVPSAATFPIGIGILEDYQMLLNDVNVFIEITMLT